MFQYYAEEAFALYARYAGLFAQMQLVLFMVGMGATLTAADFLRVVKIPQFLIVAAVMQLAVLPLLAVAINHISGVEAGVALGLVLVAAMPGGTLSKLLVYYGRGNVALTITLTTVLTLASVVTVPLLLQLLTHEYLPVDFAMPVEHVVKEVALFLLLPLTVGLSISRLAPRYCHFISRWCVRAGLVFVLMVIVGELGSGRAKPASFGWRGILVLIVFCVLAQQLAMLPFRVLRWPAEDCLAVGIEATMRNMNLALLLYDMLKTGRPAEDALMGGVFFVLLSYGATAIFVGLPLALRYRLFKKHAMPVRVASPP